MKTHEKKAVASHTTHSQSQPEAAFEAVSFGDIPRALAQPAHLRPVIPPGGAPPMQLKLVREVTDMFGGPSQQEITGLELDLAPGTAVYDDATHARYTVVSSGFTIVLRDSMGGEVEYNPLTETYTPISAFAAPVAPAWNFDADDPFGLNSFAAPSAWDSIPSMPAPLAFGSASSLGPPAQLPALLPPFGEERRKRGASPTPLTRQAQEPQEQQAAHASTTKRAKPAAQPASPSTLLGPSALSAMSHVASPPLPRLGADEADDLLAHLDEEEAAATVSASPLSGSLAAPSGFVLPASLPPLHGASAHMPLLSGSGPASPLPYAPASPLVGGLHAPASPLFGGLHGPASPLMGGLHAPASPLFGGLHGPASPLMGGLHAPASPLAFPYVAPSTPLALRSPTPPLPAAPLPAVPAPMMNLEIASAMTPKDPYLDEIDEVRAGRIFMRLQELRFRNDKGNLVPVPYHYPLDGCYGRAEMMARALDEAGYASEKAFVVSKRLPALNVASSYAADTARGSTPTIGWQYHIAPVIDVTTSSGAVVKMVLDPSMFNRPVPVADWTRMMNPDAFAEESFAGVMAMHQAHLRADASRVFSSMDAFPADYHAVTVAPRTVMDPVNVNYPDADSTAESLRPSLPLMSRFADAAPAHKLAADLRAALTRHASLDDVIGIIDGATTEARQIFRLGLMDGTRQVVAPYTQLIDQVKDSFPGVFDQLSIDHSLNR